MTTKKKAQGAAKGKAADGELDAFARHLSEVLRIARTHPAIPSRLYNGLADAWNDAQEFATNFYETPEFIRLSVAHMAGRTKKEGGAK